jgi:hypothetical protein
MPNNNIALRAEIAESKPKPIISGEVKTGSCIPEDESPDAYSEEEEAGFESPTGYAKQKPNKSSNKMPEIFGFKSEQAVYA